MTSQRWIGIVVALLISGSTLAATTDDDDARDDGNDNEITEILNSIGYPELQVVPRASERLMLEAKAERGNWFLQHWAIEFSGLYTMYVGAATKNYRRTLNAKDTADANTIASVTTTVGAGWLVGGLILGGMRPYGSGISAISKNKGKDERSELLRERLSEEALEKPAKTMRILQWMSIASNFGMNGASFVYANDKGRVIAGLGMLMSFLPAIFGDHTIDVYDKHIEYKKKIYAPLKSTAFNFDPTTRTLTPMTQLTWTF